MIIYELPERVELKLGSKMTPLGMSILRNDLSCHSQYKTVITGLDNYPWFQDFAFLQWIEAKHTVFQLLALGLYENGLISENTEGKTFKEKLNSHGVSCAEVCAQLGMEDSRRASILGMSGYGNMIPMARVIDYYSRIAFIE